MKIAIVCSRPWMRFSPDLATAQELTIRDLMKGLPDSVSAKLFAPDVPNPYADIDVCFIPQKGRLNKRFFISRLAHRIVGYRPDVVVVQQHAATASYLAKVLGIPVILHRHNDYDAPHEDFIRRWVQVQRFKKISAIAFVSEHSRQDFLRSWGRSVSCATYVVPNGMDLSGWNPVDPIERKNEILFVGRAIPEKGALELAQALVGLLPKYPHFMARFIFGAPDARPDYREKVEETISPLRSQVTIERQRPWGYIREAFENAAIAVVPSLCPEAFGRTALEAMASGTALIASTRGGLDEVVGNAAYRLDKEITPETIGCALTDLIENQKLRAELGTRGIERAEKYALQAQVNAFLQMCLEVTIQKGQKAGANA